MNDDWTVIDTVTDDSGKLLEIAHAEGKVRIAVRGSQRIVLTSIVMDGRARDGFTHAFAVAESQAEAYAIGAAEAVSG